MFTATIFVQFPANGVYDEELLPSLSNTLFSESLDEIKSKTFDYINKIVKHIDECHINVYFTKDVEYIDSEDITFKGGEMCDD